MEKGSGPILACAFVGTGWWGAELARAAASLPDRIRIAGFLSLDEAECRKLSGQHGGEVFSSLDQILSSASVDAVVLATPHSQHAAQAIAVAEAGKHVFVEKPMGLSVAECDRVVKAVADAGVVLGVGFNRRTAPLAIKAKAAFASVREPKTLLYRINAGVVPAGHWLLDDAEGGGRLFGEGVHFLDFARWMFEAQPVSVAAAALGREGTGLDLDNNSVLVTFSDGSVATIVYSGQGAGSLSKERIEIFGGGEAVVIDDFIRLERHGSRTRGARDERLRRMDKGHAALLDNFVDAIAGRVPVAASADDGYWATWCAEEAVRRLGASGGHAPGPQRG